MRMPVLFLGHGSPMNAIEDNEFHRAWGAMGRRLPRPKAVLCVSAHWETRGVHVTAAAQPETIHDFYGFPKALFDVRYRAPGDPALARRAAELAGAREDTQWGLDHGAWGVLIAMYPEADVPVVQLSLDTSRPGAFHYALARKLAPLRDEGILVLGSGNIVHNLVVWRPNDGRPYDWALRFDAEVRRRIDAGDHEALADYASLGEDARMAIPTPEHYLPLLYVLALQEKGETPAYFNDKVMTSISMTSVLIGA
jgi:4,5-DOPA dioxygenase extradiol